MAEKPKDTILPTPEPHTLVKHAILKKYLSAWFPILTSLNGFKRLIYIDGFAGSGIYQDGTKGSPIIAIESAMQQSRTINKQVDFISIEENKKRADNLKTELAKLGQLPPNYKYDVKQEDFSRIIPRIIADYNRKTPKFIAAFVFIDPFGYKIPMDIIASIMQHPSCEVLITFMYQEINRFLKDAGTDNARNALFATDKWKEVEEEKNVTKRKEFLHNLYQQQLMKAAHIKYVRSFQMVNEANSTDFFLFFGTNNQKGLREMKTAMWKADESGAYSFSDRTNPAQLVLFEPKPDYEKLERLIKAKFSGREVDFAEIEQFVLEETPFRDDAHLKNPVLALMEKRGELKVIDENGKPRKGSGFKANMLISFTQATLF